MRILPAQTRPTIINRAPIAMINKIPPMRINKPAVLRLEFPITSARFFMATPRNMNANNPMNPEISNSSSIKADAREIIAYRIRNIPAILSILTSVSPARVIEKIPDSNANTKTSIPEAIRMIADPTAAPIELLIAAPNSAKKATSTMIMDIPRSKYEIPAFL